MIAFDASDIVSQHCTLSAAVAVNKRVIVHPIVLLSVVDHYNRVAKGTSKRVVGCVLGEVVGNEIHASSSYAVPFEEDTKDTAVWYLDHNYLEKLFSMFKKVNAKEYVIGWYSTGPKIKPADLELHEVIRRYCSHPVYIIVDINPKHLVVPIDAYFSFEEASCDKQFRRTFVHIPSTIGAYEAEEVGVEHLLRDIRNASTSTLATHVGDKQNSLKNLVSKLCEISSYLEEVVSGKLPPNYKILYNLQDAFNLLPDFEENSSLVKTFSEQTNDQILTIYIASIVRSVIALHDLINNKLDDEKSQSIKKSNNTKGKIKEISTKNNDNNTDKDVSKKNDKADI